MKMNMHTVQTASQAQAVSSTIRTCDESIPPHMESTTEFILKKKRGAKPGELYVPYYFPAFSMPYKIITLYALIFSANDLIQHTCYFSGVALGMVGVKISMEAHKKLQTTPFYHFVGASTIVIYRFLHVG